MQTPTWTNMHKSHNCFCGVFTFNLQSHYHPTYSYHRNCHLHSFSIMFSFAHAFPCNLFSKEKAFVKKETTTTTRKLHRHTYFQLINYKDLWHTGTNGSTEVNKRIDYHFGDGLEITSEVSSKTTFHKRHVGRHGPSYNVHAMAALVEAAASAMAEAVVEETECEIVGWWVYCYNIPLLTPWLIVDLLEISWMPSRRLCFPWWVVWIVIPAWLRNKFMGLGPSRAWVFNFEPCTISRMTPVRNE